MSATTRTAKVRTRRFPTTGVQRRQKLRKGRTIKHARALVKLHQEIVENFLVGRAQSTRARPKADRRMLVRTFIMTGSYRKTAEQCGVGRERVRQLMVAAMRHLREIEKAQPSVIGGPAAQIDDD